ncbi:hypothetical protein D3C72_1823930 [compost metagenome]
MAASSVSGASCDVSARVPYSAATSRSSASPDNRKSCEACSQVGARPSAWNSADSIGRVVTGASTETLSPARSTVWSSAASASSRATVSSRQRGGSSSWSARTFSTGALGPTSNCITSRIGARVPRSRERATGSG